MVQADAPCFLRSLPDASAQIIFLDPPFNLGKDYSQSGEAIDSIPPEKYRAWLTKVIYECIRVLAKGGALYLYHLPKWAMRLGTVIEQDPDMSFRHWIAIAMKNGFVRGRRLYPAHYALLMFTKGEPRHFHRPKLAPKRCRKCGDFIKDYGGYRPIIEAKGINLSDFWEDLSPVRHANRKNRKANELPEELFTRIVQISGTKGGLYVDPFVGSGTGVLVALKRGMRFAACDLVESNCQLVAKRIRQLRTCSQ